MKKIIIVLMSVLFATNVSVVYSSEINDYIDNGFPEEYIYDSAIDSDWDLYVNNEKLEKENIVVSLDFNSGISYISLRSFAELMGENISWDNETGNIEFTFNKSKFLITKSEEKCDVKCLPVFFDLSYAKIKNKTTNEYVSCESSSSIVSNTINNNTIRFTNNYDKEKVDIVDIYTMNNTTYITNKTLETIAKMTNVDYKCINIDKRIEIKKYNYDKEFIINRIKNGMTYSEVVGCLGTNDYFQLIDSGGCLVRYNCDIGYVELGFSEYTDESDMKLIYCSIFSKDGNLEEEIIK